jgi:hypothetical protein
MGQVSLVVVQSLISEWIGRRRDIHNLWVAGEQSGLYESQINVQVTRDSGSRKCRLNLSV